MKTAFIAAAITSLASVASAQGGFNIKDLPQCSLQCFLTTLSGDGCSSVLDYECHCKKSGLVETITPCVQKACEAKDQATVASAVVGLCSQYGVSISVPDIPGQSTAAPASSAATSAVASATEEASSVVSSVASSVASSVSSVLSSASEAVSSASEAASSDTATGAASSTVSTASATDVVVSGTPSSSAGASTPTTPSTPGPATPTSSSFEGAAAKGGAIAGVLGFAVAIAAFAGL